MKVEITNVPSKVAIIGQGKISSHIPKLFQEVFDSFIVLDRTSDQKIELAIDDVTNVFLAVQDQNIESVYLNVKNVFPKNTIFFHLSGALSFENIIGVHPLMTFSKETILNNYSEIPLYTDSDWFYQSNKNKLKNLKYIPSTLKSKYHAMAVMTGNFTQYYLQLVKQNFPEDLDFLAYKELTLKSVNSIFSSETNSVLTGPLVRKDKATISSHKRILKNDDPKLLKIYETMEHLFQEELFSNEN